jgi:hypothetical protein
VAWLSGSILRSLRTKNRQDESFRPHLKYERPKFEPAPSSCYPPHAENRHGRIGKPGRFLGTQELLSAA